MVTSRTPSALPAAPLQTPLDDITVAETPVRSARPSRMPWSSSSSSAGTGICGIAANAPVGEGPIVGSAVGAGRSVGAGVDVASEEALGGWGGAGPAGRGAPAQPAGKAAAA